MSFKVGDKVRLRMTGVAYNHSTYAYIERGLLTIGKSYYIKEQLPNGFKFINDIGYLWWVETEDLELVSTWRVLLPNFL